MGAPYARSFRRRMLRWKLTPQARAVPDGKRSVRTGIATYPRTPAFLMTADVVSSPRRAPSSGGISFGMRPRGSGLTPSR
jgi:hypothetical protein